ncbi:MAG: YopX family protein [Clostridium sp.]|uniref:YopX family protein n=1 Tax=Clostridium sp. TaxID=1506 RepID=UPI003EE4904D
MNCGSCKFQGTDCKYKEHKKYSELALYDSCVDDVLSVICSKYEKREIKFRAYDENNNLMIYSDKLDCESKYWFNIGGQGVTCNRSYSRFEGEHEYIGSEVLDNIVQYTGMKDTNGTEIYEGDIIKAKFIRDKSIMTCEISILEYEYVLTNLDTGEIIKFDEFYRRSLEVVGNVYENPELVGV